MWKYNIKVDLVEVGEVCCGSCIIRVQQQICSVFHGIWLCKLPMGRKTRESQLHGPSCITIVKLWNLFKRLS